MQNAFVWITSLQQSTAKNNGSLISDNVYQLLLFLSGDEQRTPYKVCEGEEQNKSINKSKWVLASANCLSNFAVFLLSLSLSFLSILCLCSAHFVSLCCIVAFKKSLCILSRSHSVPSYSSLRSSILRLAWSDDDTKRTKTINDLKVVSISPFCHHFGAAAYRCFACKILLHTEQQRWLQLSSERRHAERQMNCTKTNKTWKKKWSIYCTLSAIKLASSITTRECAKTVKGHTKHFMHLLFVRLLFCFC